MRGGRRRAAASPRRPARSHPAGSRPLRRARRARSRRPRGRRPEVPPTGSGHPALAGTPSVREPARDPPVLPGDLVLVGAGQVAVAHDLLARNEQPVDPMRPAEHETCDWIVRAAELETVRAPYRDVSALARLERADIRAVEHSGAP